MNPASLPSNLPATLQDSWQRCLDQGLDPGQPLPENALARTDLADRLEANARLLTFSQPVIENLYKQIGCPSSTVLLTDKRGLILSALGDTGFLDRAARVALSPGAEWSEANMGTNAIGTALRTGEVVEVQGQQHFFERNRFLTCVAAPILAPTGGIAGILDISTDARADLSHADALLRTTAELIEHRLVESLEVGFLTVRFHLRTDLIGTPFEALAVFDEGGRLLACNRPARTLLKQYREYPDASCAECFSTEWRHLVGWAALAQPTPFPLRTIHGQTCVARATLRQPPVAHRPASAPEPARAPASPPPALPRRALLDTIGLGDPRVAAALETLAQWAQESGPLLIEGETGSGKRHLVHAFHADHGGDTALVSVDCGALAASPQLRAETDHALRQAEGGILYLVDADALPLAEQAHLFAASSADTRLIAAVRNPLDALARAGSLALDAFQARHGRVVQLPPLRERSDFDALVRRFVRDACPDRPLYVCPDALALLRRYRWPGNLSELNNRLRLILALMGDDAGQMCPEDIPEELLEPALG